MRCTLVGRFGVMYAFAVVMRTGLRHWYLSIFVVFFFLNRRTALGMGISYWSSDVCSSDFIARRVEVYPCSAPQSDRQYVWHAEIGSHAADVDRQRGFTRETLCQHADVASGPADIHHDGVFDPGQQGGTAHAVGGAGADGEHGVAGGFRSEAHTSELQSLM